MSAGSGHDDIEPAHPTANVFDTEQVDQFVSRASAGLAAWLAVPVARRRELVRDLSLELLARLDADSARALDPDLFEVTRQSVQRSLAMATSTDPLDNHGFRPGICAFIHHRSRRPGKFFAAAVGAALLRDSVAVVRFSVGAGRLLGATVGAATAVGMPDGTITVVSGEEETIDALVSSPLVATVFTDGPEDQVAHVAQLAERFGKALIDYPEDPRFG